MTSSNITNTVEVLAETQTEVRMMQIWRKALKYIPRNRWYFLCEQFAKDHPQWKIKVNGKEIKP